MEFSVNKRTMIQKFIHKRLPCNQREHLFYEYKPPYCRHCKEIVESQNHIIQCLNCPKRKILKKNYILMLESYFQHTGINETTKRVILKYIGAWISQQETPELKDIAPEASHSLKQAVEDQNKIGWDQWLKGRISIKWGEMVNYDLINKKVPKAGMSAEKWGKEVIVKSWQFVLECWFTRNESEHDNENNPVLRTKEKLLEEIMWVIRKIPNEVDHPYKDTNEITMLTMPVNNLTMLLEQVKTLIPQFQRITN
jgi:hypothetical protein